MSWLAEHGFTLLQSAGIIGSLLFTGLQLTLDARSRRVENRLTITRHHREIWQSFADDPKLDRVLCGEVDLENEPITEAERIFINSLILHLNAALTAYREGMAQVPEGLKADVRELFSKPIPRNVWESTALLRDTALRDLIDTA